MRLSSKALCRAASPRLFQHVVALYPNNRQSWTVEELRQLCDSRYASHVRQVDVKIQSCQFAEAQTYLEDLAGLLPSLLCKLPKLYSLGFEYDGALKFPVEPRSLISSSMATILRYIELPELKELDIYFPTTFDFGQLLSRESSRSRIPVEVVCGRLRHLGLGVRNYTSQAGQRYWPNPVLPEDASVPNETFANNLFELVEAAEKLDSVSICCTNPLDFDDVRFPLHLRTINLSRVIISSDTLSAVLGNFEGLTSVQFYGVELKAGTWQNTLTRLAQSPLQDLVEFYMDSCGYSSTGASSHLREGYLPAPDNPVSIETRNDRDFQALYLLQKLVIKNRDARGLPDDYAYEKAQMFSVEELKSTLSHWE
jgi:hypothetical protein